LKKIPHFDEVKKSVQFAEFNLRKIESVLVELDELLWQGFSTQLQSLCQGVNSITEKLEIAKKNKDWAELVQLQTDSHKLLNSIIESKMMSFYIRQIHLKEFTEFQDSSNSYPSKGAFINSSSSLDHSQSQTMSKLNSFENSEDMGAIAIRTPTDDAANAEALVPVKPQEYFILKPPVEPFLSRQMESGYDWKTTNENDRLIEETKTEHGGIDKPLLHKIDQN